MMNYVAKINSGKFIIIFSNVNIIIDLTNKRELECFENKYIKNIFVDEFIKNFKLSDKMLDHIYFFLSYDFYVKMIEYDPMYLGNSPLHIRENKDIAFKAIRTRPYAKAYASIKIQEEWDELYGDDKELNKFKNLKK